jgi:hypothetical protein
MSAPVDVPQNLHIHVVPAQRIPQAKQPDASNNHQSQDFQDYFQNSQEKVQEKQKKKKQQKHHPLPVGIKPEEKLDDYEDVGESVEEKKADIHDLGNHIDTKI